MTRYGYLNAVPLSCPLGGRYPTQEEILEEPRPFFRFGLFRVISRWKHAYYRDWSSKLPDDRLVALQKLADGICGLYGVEPVAVISEENGIDRYESGKIILSGTSIITLLHELAHHLFGRSEYHACRWSVWLYQLRFRTAYETLTWHGHVLKSPSS